MSQAIASVRELPHISSEGLSPEQQAGRSGLPKIMQRMSASRFAHGTPAGLPFGMPGMGLLIEGAMQHAPQPGRQGRIIGIPAVSRAGCLRTVQIPPNPNRAANPGGAVMLPRGAIPRWMSWGSVARSIGHWVNLCGMGPVCHAF